MATTLCSSSSRLQRQPGGLQAAKRFLGLAPQHRRPTRTSLRAACHGVIEANELNKWADRSGQDDDCNWEHGQFDQETASLVLRVLTAKATQRLLIQLEELDLHKARWMNHYCSEHPPNQGNKFLVALMKAPGSVVTDLQNKTTHTIDPANLAHRIIQIRSDMAATMVSFPKFVELENTGVMREHLQSTMYISGTSDKGYTDRRGYRRSR